MSTAFGRCLTCSMDEISVNCCRYINDRHVHMRNRCVCKRSAAIARMGWQNTAIIPRQEHILGRCRLLTHAREVPYHRFALKTLQRTIGKQRKRHRFNIGKNGRFTVTEKARGWNDRVVWDGIFRNLCSVVIIIMYVGVMIPRYPDTLFVLSAAQGYPSSTAQRPTQVSDRCTVGRSAVCAKRSERRDTRDIANRPCAGTDT
jgi:hypothetical protein